MKKMLIYIKLHLYRKLVSIFKKIMLSFINIHFHIMVANLKYTCRKMVIRAKLIFEITEY